MGLFFVFSLFEIEPAVHILSVCPLSKISGLFLFLEVCGIPYPEGASDYTKNRIKAAVEAYRLGDQGCQIKEEERQMERDNLAEATAARNQRIAERTPELVVPEPVAPQLRQN